VPAHEHINEDQSGPFVRLYRGLAATSASELNQKSVGVHWTPDKEVAKKWVDPEKAGIYPPTEGAMGNWNYMYGQRPWGGVLITARVHKRHIMDENTPEWSDVTSESMYGYSLGSAEKETTVRPGSRIHVMQIEEFDDDGNTTSVHERGTSPHIPFRAFRA
jgi:hypothetical protein